MSFIGKLPNFNSLTVPQEPQTEGIPQQPAAKPATSTGIASTPDGFETVNPMNPNLYGLVGEQTEILVSNQPVIPPDPTVDASLLFDYVADVQEPAPPVPPEGVGQSLGQQWELGLDPQAAIDAAQGNEPAEDAEDWFTDTAGDVLDFPGDAARWAGRAVEDALLTIDATSKDVGAAIGDAAEAVGAAAGDVAEGIHDVLNSVTGGTFGEVASDVGEMVEQTVIDFGYASMKVGAAIGDAAEGTANAVGDAVGWTVEAAEEIAKAAAQAAADAAKAAAQAAADAAKAVAAAGEATGEAVGDVLEEVGEVAEDVAEGINDGAEAVIDWLF